MLAGIAERVLGSVLGKYVEGLDKKNINVGIWSGDFVIENVSVKPEVMDIANLPMNLLFSHIGRIRALIPWKDLSGSPVEIEMDDLYIIAAPKTLEDIEKIGVDLFNDRHSMINEFAKTMEENIKKSAKDKAKEDGYISKLTTKIIDNVQVRIKNIHIRFECKVMDKPMFSFGMTLDGLTIYTTDEAGTKIYVDRTNKKNEGKPMHKRLHLVDFSVYWNFEN
jgi:vacuolar protein sorting-associated protein 13A/C